MAEYDFIFSVVMSVYNVEQYIHEAIDSLIHQTIGFEKIQLILTDDGSTDQSGRICDECAAKYPDNVEVHHKANGGLSAARNDGLKHVKGKYVNFLDPDDYIDKDMFQKVSTFMEAHPEVDMCCVPIFMFGNVNTQHGLNDKFEKGTRVIDLSEDENSRYVILSAASSFFRAYVAIQMNFDTVIYTAEDAIEIQKILIHNPYLGVVSDAVYHYRRYGDSTTSKAKTKKNWYTEYMKRYAQGMLDYAEQELGYVPKYTQSAVMYDLQWKLLQSYIPFSVLPAQEAEDYKRILFNTVCRIDDDVILRQRNLESTYKAFILGKKYGSQFEFLFDSAENDAYLQFRSGASVSISGMRTSLEFLKKNAKTNTCILEGFHRIALIDADSVCPCLFVNGKELACEITDRSRMSEICLGETVSRAIGFRAEFPLQDEVATISLALRVKGALVTRQNITFGGFFPVSRIYDNAYAFVGGRMVTVNDKGICISPKPSWTGRTIRECKLLCEIWKKNLLGGRKAVAGRLYYHIVGLFKRRKLWIISDRIQRADDNGEALFCYLQKHKPKNTRVVFAISKSSPDYARLSKYGKCVDAMSFRHKLLHLLCDVNISAQADGVTVNPFNGHHDALRDLLVHQRFVFLQHGITQNDISDWLNRYNKDINGFVTAAYPEHLSIINGNYGYSKEKVWLTGFPRFDLLYANEQKKITLMPTWRRYLMGSVDDQKGVWKTLQSFKDSQYYRFYSSLLNSNKLLDKLEECGYTLQFFVHPNLRLAGVQFPTDVRVKCLDTQTSYREIYAESALVITDYSSAAFDFAYMRKPLIYCQFDKQEFFAGEHVCKQGYFDYERDGFGEVTYDLKSTIDLIIDYVEHDCKLKPVYRERIDRFFAFNDKNNCQRVLDKILELQEQSRD